MAIRKSMREELVVSGNREDWMHRCENALKSAHFTRVIKNVALYQIEANFKKFTVWGTISITLIPEEDNIRIVAVSTANMDNIYALFRSPNKVIISKFKNGLR